MIRNHHCQTLLVAGVLSLLLAFTLQGCQRQTNSAAPLDARAADEAAIRSVADAWFKAILAKDLDQTLSFYAEEAEYLPANRAAATTPAERRKVWVEDYALPGFASTEVTKKIEVARSGDLAYQSGTYVVTTLNSARQATQSTGKFIVIWKKQADGKWKAVVDIDNADN